MQMKWEMFERTPKAITWVLQSVCCGQTIEIKERQFGGDGVNLMSKEACDEDQPATPYQCWKLFWDFYAEKQAMIFEFSKWYAIPVESQIC